MCAVDVHHERAARRQRLAFRRLHVSRRPVRPVCVRLPQRLHAGRHQPRPLHRHHLPAAAAHDHPPGGARDRAHLDAVDGRAAADRVDVAHHPAKGQLRRAARQVRRGVAGGRAALLLQPRSHGAAVLPAAVRALVHLLSHRHRHLGEAAARRGGEQSRPAHGRVQTQGECIVMRGRL